MVTRVPGYQGTRVPVSAGTSGTRLNRPHPVGYPVRHFEAGVQL